MTEPKNAPYHCLVQLSGKLTCSKLLLQEAPAGCNSTSDSRLLPTTTQAIQRIWVGFKYLLGTFIQ